VPPKIRELLSNLEKSGFVNRGGKGSHRNYEHPNGSRITISGKLSADAKPYQEKLVKQKLEEILWKTVTDIWK
jgi:predicted RNA binding protein YcfA (HicA-like mRNA interferase family)